MLLVVFFLSFFLSFRFVSFLAFLLSCFLAFLLSFLPWSCVSCRWQQSVVDVFGLGISLTWAGRAGALELECDIGFGVCRVIGLVLVEHHGVCSVRVQQVWDWACWPFGCLLVLVLVLFLGAFDL